MDLTKRFAENLIREREDAGLTADELAIRADLPLAEVLAFEAGETQPDLTALAKLAGSLGTSVGVLIAGLEWDQGEDSGTDRRS